MKRAVDSAPSSQVPVWVLLLSLLALWLTAHSTAAQDKSKYYTIRHPDEFTIDWTAFYAKIDVGTAKARKELTHHLDLAFGDHPKQALDLYLPSPEPNGAATFLFLHGGGFREGDRAHYGVMALPFAENGIITAVASYRLTGDGYHFPDQPEDVQKAIAWLYANIDSYGGDQDRIYVGGHSAGAILSAHVSVRGGWREKLGVPMDVIKGSVPISGPYDLRIGAYEEREGEADAYVNQLELRAEASPIVNIESPAPRNVVAVGELEGKYLDASRKFVEKLRQAGVEAELLVLDGLDHDGTALALADEQSALFRATLKMIQNQ